VAGAAPGHPIQTRVRGAFLAPAVFSSLFWRSEGAAGSVRNLISASVASANELEATSRLAGGPFAARNDSAARAAEWLVAAESGSHLSDVYIWPPRELAGELAVLPACTVSHTSIVFAGRDELGLGEEQEEQEDNDDDGR
jgi:hypothetical protein